MFISILMITLVTVFTSFSVNGKDAPIDRERVFVHHKPCKCEVEWKIFDFGIEYFPRYVMGANCSPRKCGDHTIKCKEYTYEYTLLKLFDEDVDKRGKNHLPVPHELGDGYFFLEKSLPVGCELDYESIPDWNAFLEGELEHPKICNETVKN